MKPSFEQHEIEFRRTLEDGNIKTTYLFEGKPCFAAELTSHRARQCAAMQSIIKDLELVSNTLGAAVNLAISNNHACVTGYNGSNNFDPKNTTDITLWALYSSAIITYAKCFTDAKNGRKYSLQEAQLKNLSEDSKKLYKYIMSLRHEWIAHGGNNHQESAKAIALLDPDNWQDRAITHFFNTAYSNIPHVALLMKFLQLVNDTYKISVERLTQMDRLLMENELLKTPLEEFKKIATLKITTLKKHPLMEDPPKEI